MNWDRFDLLAGLASGAGLAMFSYTYTPLSIVQIIVVGTILGVVWPIFRHIINDCFPEDET